MKNNEDYVAQKQQSFDLERLDLQSKHQSEVGEHKSLLAKLEEQLNLAERESTSLKESHKSEIESLRLELLAAVDAKEKQRLDLENQSKQEIARLEKELETCQQNVKKLEETKQLDVQNAVRNAEVYTSRFATSHSRLKPRKKETAN